MPKVSVKGRIKERTHNRSYGLRNSSSYDFVTNTNSKHIYQTRNAANAFDLRS